MRIVVPIAKVDDSYTFSTIIDFTLKGMLDRVHKLAFIGAMEATGEFDFPQGRNGVFCS